MLSASAAPLLRRAAGEGGAVALRHASLLLTNPQQESPTQTAGVGQLRVYIPPRLVMLWRTLAVKEERSQSQLFL